MHWTYGWATDKGKFKQLNEDRCTVLSGHTPTGTACLLAMVADGMGGHASGEQASAYCQDKLQAWWEREILHSKAYAVDSELLAEIYADSLFAEIAAVNTILSDWNTPGISSPGTTLTLLFTAGQQYTVFHTGDSRIYRLTADSAQDHLQQLTEDQTWVAEEIRQGRLAAEQQLTHPKRHVLTHCLGINTDLHIHRQAGRLGEEELFFLCSDGFYSLFWNEEIERMLAIFLEQYQDVQMVCEAMLKVAYDLESRDNLSIVIVRGRSHKENWLRRLWR